VPLKEHYPKLPVDLVHELAMLKIRLSGLKDSGGEVSRRSCPAACASARASRARSRSIPALLFLDEPTAGLDPIGAAAFDDLIRGLQRSLGLTVFLITHDLDTLYAICDRVAVLADRKVLVNAPLAEVERFEHPWVQEYFHGPRGRAAQSAVATEGVTAMETPRQPRADRPVHHHHVHPRGAVRAVGGELDLEPQLGQLRHRLHRGGDRPVDRRHRPVQRHQRRRGPPAALDPKDPRKVIAAHRLRPDTPVKVRHQGQARPFVGLYRRRPDPAHRRPAREPAARGHARSGRCR
jgi:energy-coupling factor transporter ATP-binding protein EcfA2